MTQIKGYTGNFQSVKIFFSKEIETMIDCIITILKLYKNWSTLRKDENEQNNFMVQK